MVRTLTNYVTDPTKPHLGGNIRGGDLSTFAPDVWDWVVKRYCVRSVLDIGSGEGHAADYFSRLGCRPIAVDGLADNVAKAHYPTVRHDFTTGAFQTSPVDLVHCQEFVEHVDEIFVGNVLETFSAGRVVLMTHAVPGQNGYHHVNLQPQEYWINAVEGTGKFRYLPHDTVHLRALNSVYFKHSGLLFHAR